MEHTSILSTCQTFLNLFATLSEVLGLAFGIHFLGAGLIFLFPKRFDLARIFAVAGVGSFLYALLICGFINVIAPAFATVPELGVLVGAFGTLFILSAAIFVTFLPTMISAHRGIRGVDIALMNVAAIVFRPLWYFALYQAIMRKKEDVAVA